jgi:sortase A
VAILRIPVLGLEKAVVEGVSSRELAQGPGHYPDTPLPGQAGNAAIAGHRTTYGAPFNHLDGLHAGDDIWVTTLQGQFHYEVVDSRVVNPHDISLLGPTTDNRLTLTTCHPEYSASERYVVIAELVGDPVPAPVEPDQMPSSPSGTEPAPATDLGTTTTTQASPEATPSTTTTSTTSTSTTTTTTTTTTTPILGDTSLPRSPGV